MDHGILLTPLPEWKKIVSDYPDCLPVCLINNGPFSAAGVAYCEQEFEEFKVPDGRPRVWFLCEVKDLESVSPLKEYLKLGGKV